MAGETRPQTTASIFDASNAPVVPDQLMGTRPYRVRGYRIGKLTTSDPRACNDFTVKNAFLSFTSRQISVVQVTTEESLQMV